MEENREGKETLTFCFYGVLAGKEIMADGQVLVPPSSQFELVMYF
jgi:hypothetical protein